MNFVDAALRYPWTHFEAARIILKFVSQKNMIYFPLQFWTLNTYPSGTKQWLETFWLVWNTYFCSFDGFKRNHCLFSWILKLTAIFFDFLFWNQIQTSFSAWRPILCTKNRVDLNFNMNSSQKIWQYLEFLSFYEIADTSYVVFPLKNDSIVFL